MTIKEFCENHDQVFVFDTQTESCVYCGSIHGLSHSVTLENLEIVNISFDKNSEMIVIDI